MIDPNALSRLITADVQLRLVEPGIYSVYPETGNIAAYDHMATFYDAVMGNRFYNRIMWGYWPAELSSFCRNALTSSTEGWVLDVGCGSLVFTARIYANYSERPVVLADESIEMIRAAKARLVKLKGSVPSNVFLLQADALQLPFKPQSFQTVISMNLLHVLPDAKRALVGLQSVSAAPGTMSFTTLVRNKRFGGAYMNMLSRKGLIIPRTEEQLLASLDTLSIRFKHEVKGNMMFIHCSGTEGT